MKEYTNEKRVLFRRHECYVRLGEVVTLASPHDFERMYRARFAPAHAPAPRLQWVIEGEPSEILRMPPRSEIKPSDEVAPADFFTPAELEAVDSNYREVCEQYNAELTAYQKDLVEYLEMERIHGFLAANGNYTSLLLENNGEASLRDVRIELTFPEGFAVAHESSVPERSARPVRPQRPSQFHGLAAQLLGASGMTALLKLANGMAGAGLSPMPMSLAPIDPIDFMGEGLEVDSERRIVAGEVRRLGHGVAPHQFEDLIVVVPPSAPCDYEIPYVVHADNLPQPHRGSLRLIVAEGAPQSGAHMPETRQPWCVGPHCRSSARGTSP